MIKNWLLCVVCLSFLIGTSFLIYSIHKARQAIPSIDHTTRPNLRINEGGKACFDRNSLWFQLKNGEVSHIEDALWLGGTDPKFLLTIDKQHTKMKGIWKPQLPTVNKHYAMAQNEVIYFHLDCMLNLGRTPPAAVYPLDYQTFKQSLIDRTKLIFYERDAPWNIWKSTKLVHGAVQVMWSGVNHVNVFGEHVIKFLQNITKYFGASRELYVYLLGGNSVSIRELSSRDLIDYIIGNWDRNHNQFFVYDAKRGNTELIYLDHNHFKLSSKEPFKLRFCKFWKSDVDNLRKLVDGDIKQTLLSSLRDYEPDFKFVDDQMKPIAYLHDRSMQFLEHVENCINQYGYNYVFEE